MTASYERARFGSRDPLAFPRITGFCDRHGKTRDPARRDPGYQNVCNSTFMGRRVSLTLIITNRVPLRIARLKIRGEYDKYGGDSRNLFEGIRFPVSFPFVLSVFFLTSFFPDSEVPGATELFYAKLVSSSPNLE
jgi:hypothetical protein